MVIMSMFSVLIRVSGTASFQKGIESDNGHDDNGRIIRLDPREWEGFEPALPASKPILETKAFSGDELFEPCVLVRLILLILLPVFPQTMRPIQHGTGSSALDTIHDLAEASIFKL